MADWWACSEGRDYSLAPHFLLLGMIVCRRNENSQAFIYFFVVNFSMSSSFDDEDDCIVERASDATNLGICAQYRRAPHQPAQVGPTGSGNSVSHNSFRKIPIYVSMHNSAYFFCIGTIRPASKRYASADVWRLDTKSIQWQRVTFAGQGIGRVYVDNCIHCHISQTCDAASIRHSCQSCV